MDNYSDNIYLSLTDLIARKNERDKQELSLSQLAQAIGIPLKMLTNLLHPDPTQRTHNPQLPMLTKIVHFFQGDGFDITLDALVSGLTTSSIELSDLDKITFIGTKTIPLYNLSAQCKDAIGDIEVYLSSKLSGDMAFLAEEEMLPLFPKGSVFIVNCTTPPENGALVAVRVEGCHKILIRKLHIQGHKRILSANHDKIAPIVLFPTNHYQIIGIVIQVNISLGGRS